jgi:hypothetical protein
VSCFDILPPDAAVLMPINIWATGALNHRPTTMYAPQPLLQKPYMEWSSRPQTLVEDRKAEVLETYERGRPASIAAFAKRWNVSDETMRRSLVRWGVKLTSHPSKFEHLKDAIMRLDGQGLSIYDIAQKVGLTPEQSKMFIG